MILGVRVREERAAECREEKFSEEGRVFCYDGCRVVMPNGHFFFDSMLMFNGCRVVMPNDHFFFVFNIDVQWVSGSHAEWSSLFNVQC